MKEIMNIYKEVNNYYVLANELGRAYAEYVKMTYANPGKYHRNEQYGRTEDGKFWYKIVVTKED
jgi:hypothetical protein